VSWVVGCRPVPVGGGDNRWPAPSCTNRAGRERNCWPIGPGHVVGGLSRPAGPGWGNGWPFGPFGAGARCLCEMAFRPPERRHRLRGALHKPSGLPGGSWGRGGRGLVWGVVLRPNRAVVRPKGPAVLPARVVGPGKGIPPTHRPAQRANRSSNRAGHEKNCWPVGPRHVVGGLSRPAGLGWGNGWPFGPVGRLTMALHKPLGWTAGSWSGACSILGWFSAHWGGGLPMNADWSGHGGPLSRHPVTGPRRTVCSEGGSANGGWAEPW